MAKASSWTYPGIRIRGRGLKSEREVLREEVTGWGQERKAGVQSWLEDLK
jgi:hypothetical protein